VVSDYDVYHHSLVCRAAELVVWAAVKLARLDRRHHSNEMSREGNLPISTSQVSNRYDSGQCGTAVGILVHISRERLHPTVSCHIALATSRLRGGAGCQSVAWREGPRNVTGLAVLSHCTTTRIPVVLTSYLRHHILDHVTICGLNLFLFELTNDIHVPDPAIR
jgi:hypothetical protein